MNLLQNMGSIVALRHVAGGKEWLLRGLVGSQPLFRFSGLGLRLLPGPSHPHRPTGIQLCLGNCEMRKAYLPINYSTCSLLSWCGPSL